MQAYKKLKEIFYKTSLLSDIDGILQWDLSTMMPKKARNNRAKQISILNKLKFETLNENSVIKLFEKVEEKKLSKENRLNFKQMKKEFFYFRALPKELIDKKILIATSCEGKWREAKKKSNFIIVKSDLEKLIKLVKEESKILSDHYECSQYDALIKKYDDSYTYKEIKVFFNELFPFLNKAYEIVSEKQKKLNIYSLNKTLSEQQQFYLANFFMKKLGFDFGKGRLDKSAHPFCGGSIDDIRITTRIDKNNTFSFFEAIIHETGHALYEMGLPKKWKYQPAGKSGGMALHESQSLFYEMHVFKSLEFKKYFSSILKNKFKFKGKIWEGENLNNISNFVKKQYIRVDADEITYPLHVLLRFDIEYKIIEEDFKVSELPDIWNEEFKRLFNFDVDKDSNGCLQDIHWFSGDFGYFPTYTLGAMIAAQISDLIQTKMPKFKEHILEGKFDNLKKWLTHNIHEKASFYSTKQILKMVTNDELKTSFFINYIKSKYLN